MSEARVVIRECSISDIETCKNFPEIEREYAAECAIADMPPPLAKAETYKHLETTGTIKSFGAFLDEELVGFIVVIPPVLPHYSVRVGIGESFFVLKQYRKTGAGIKLLHKAEEYALEVGGVGILISSPIGVILAEILPFLGYVEISRVFFRKLGDE